MPAYQTEGAVAFDLYSRETIEIAPKQLVKAPSNLIVEIPKGYGLIIAARSGLAPKKGIALRNGIGVIDQDFHGPQDEIGILLYNFTDAPVTIDRGERIAQALILPIEHAEIEETTENFKTESRGGFGSTGK